MAYRSPVILSINEEETVRRAVGGDASALSTLIRIYRPLVFQAARKTLRRFGLMSEVDDVVQEVLGVEVPKSIRLYSGDSRFSSWIWGVSQLHAYRYVRSKGQKESQVFVDDEDGYDQVDNLPDPGLGPHELFQARERARRAQGMIEHIKPKKRQVLILHDLEGVPAAEIADRLFIPIDTVRTRLFHARKELTAMAVDDPMLREFYLPEKDQPKPSHTSTGALR